MTHINSTSCKRRKRGGKVFGFKTFCDQGNPVDFSGPFRDNIKKLLDFTHSENTLNGGMKCWSFQLELDHHSPVHFSLFIIEEVMETSVSRHCHHCQYIGWGHHLICNERFHFVLPSKETALMMTVSSPNCEDNEGLSNTMTGKQNFVELQGHLLHGVLHSDGFGHLICINGIEKGSDLAGKGLMDFWDRICTGLRARTVSVNDTAKKKNMDLRLIHGVAFGEPWFCRWGYRLLHGSYGVPQLMYQKAIEGLQSMPLFLLIQHFGASDYEILSIFNRYQTMSGHSLSTLGHLFCFMQEIKHRLPLDNHTVPVNNSKTDTETTCRWSPKRIDMATRVIVEALKRAEFRWVSRQEVRDAARAYIGDTGLLDFVLKSLGNHIVGNFIVRRTVNPVTKVLEYCLEDISNTFCNQEGFPLTSTTTKSRSQFTKNQLTNDMLYLYKYIFTEPRPTSLQSAISMAMSIILDAKYLVKDYRGELYPKFAFGSEERLKLLCTVSLQNKDNSGHGSSEGTKKALPPYNVVSLPPHATFKELKLEVERSFKETYWGLKSLSVNSLKDVDAKESDLVFAQLEAGSSLVFAGSITDRETNVKGIYESKNDSEVVDCPCGAKEDDGEKLIKCDICEARQQNQCASINNTEDVPHIFLCSRCEQDIILFPSLP
ncbi:Phd finger protein male sterility [Thalictrum thalictroides]|uniref:Phd finger protein male sterility n=1 Tax=Thalictrum thalictroides TaxID=46969 RepID=A0A7J6WLB1_THATH|nr:Phd finger protein male sterility [Thalictrum thalictroides]